MSIQRYAIVDQNNNVVNVVSYDSDPNSPTWHGPWSPPAGQTMVLDLVGASPGWTLSNSVLTPPPPPVVAPPTSLQAAQAKLASILVAGCQIVSTGTPALNGTYGMDATSLLEITAIEASIAGGQGLPGGGATFLLHDITAAPHTFDATSFPNFAKAMRDYFAAAKQAFYVAAGGGSPQWPTQPVTIP